MRFLLLFFAAIVAVFAGVAALQLSNKNTSAPQPVVVVDHQTQSVSTVDILVARNPIAAGAIVTQAMLDTQPWPENLVLKGFIPTNSPEANIVGKVTRSSLQAREPFISNKLANINEGGFLAAKLPTGMRAVTLATDAVSGVAGFVYPADHVDVLFTHNIPHQIRANAKPSGKPEDTSIGNDKPAYSEVLVPNALVLAINLRDPVNKDDNQAPAAAVAPSSITIEVSAIEAENIRLAEKIGTLSLSLRSIRDAENPGTTPPTDLTNLTNVHLSEQAMEDDSVRITKR